MRLIVLRSKMKRKFIFCKMGNLYLSVFLKEKDKVRNNLKKEVQ